MPWLAVRLGLGEWAGLAAGWGGALVPLHYWGESMGVFENTLAALLLLAFVGWAGPQIQGLGRTVEEAGGGDRRVCGSADAGVADNAAAGGGAGRAGALADEA